MKDLIRKIRDYTSAGFLECKKAAEESGGDFDKAIKILKEKGIAKAVKKHGNDVEHGLVVIKSSLDQMILLHFQAQTDFAVKSDAFCKFADYEANLFLNSNENSLKNVINDDSESFQDRLSFFISTLGENIVLKHEERFENTSDVKYVSYLHKKINSNFNDIGMIGVILTVNASANVEICLDIARHIAATDSLVLSADLVTPAMVEENPEIKNYVLLDQEYFYDASLSVKEFIDANGIKIFDFKIFFG